MDRPGGITLIAVVLAIQGVVSTILGLESAGVLSLGLGAAAESGAQGWGYVISGLLTLLVAYGLFSLQGWARMVAMIVLVVRIAFDVWAIVTHGLGSSIGIAAVVQLVVSALILWYLTTPRVREAFQGA